MDELATQGPQQDKPSPVLPGDRRRDGARGSWCRGEGGWGWVLADFHTTHCEAPPELVRQQVLTFKLLFHLVCS